MPVRGDLMTLVRLVGRYGRRNQGGGKAGGCEQTLIICKRVDHRSEFVEHRGEATEQIQTGGITNP